MDARRLGEEGVNKEISQGGVDQQRVQVPQDTQVLP